MLIDLNPTLNLANLYITGVFGFKQETKADAHRFESISTQTLENTVEFSTNMVEFSSCSYMDSTMDLSNLYITVIIGFKRSGV